jgi:hypothetical protein
MWSSTRSALPRQVAAARFTPASLIAFAISASAPGSFLISMTRSNAIWGLSHVVPALLDGIALEETLDCLP